MESVNIPGLVLVNDAIKTLEDLLQFVETKAKSQVEQFGSHNPMLIGTISPDAIGIFDFSLYEIPRQRKEVALGCLATIRKLRMPMCCFVMQSVAVWFKDTPETHALLERYRSGELNIHDHPDKKFMLQMFLQRPGSIRIISYDLIKEGEKTTLGGRQEMKNPKGYNLFDFYDHSRVN